MTDIETVRETLREIVDPCSAATGSNLDIVEMGLVKSIENSDGHVAVEIRLTTPACHMVSYFIKEIETRVDSLSGIDSVEVEIDYGDEWTNEMMSEEAKQRRQEVLDQYESQSREKAESASHGDVLS